jgi:GH25 family lysozyme M1 (1,4-beta-N-acetylmuramidase)
MEEASTPPEAPRHYTVHNVDVVKGENDVDINHMVIGFAKTLKICYGSHLAVYYR